MRGLALPCLLVLAVIVAGCTAAPEVATRAGDSPATQRVAKLAAPPPLLGPDGQVRFVTTVSNEVRAEDAATGAVRWTLTTPVLASGSVLHWRLLAASEDSVYVQAVLDEGSPTYLGTRRIDARTGVELASDIKFEIYWYENVVLWTALTHGGGLQMAIERARAAGGGYRLRTFDPLTLKVLTDVPQPTPPVPPAHSGT